MTEKNVVLLIQRDLYHAFILHCFKFTVPAG